MKGEYSVLAKYSSGTFGVKRKNLLAVKNYLSNNIVFEESWVHVYGKNTIGV
jgi:hypothetical protein